MADLSRLAYRAFKPTIPLPVFSQIVFSRIHASPLIYNFVPYSHLNLIPYDSLPGYTGMKLALTSLLSIIEVYCSLWIPNAPWIRRVVTQVTPLHMIQYISQTTFDRKTSETS